MGRTSARSPNWSSPTSAVALPVIASGGVTTIEDVKTLAGLNLAGCIIGRALYEGKLDLTEALRAIA